MVPVFLRYDGCVRNKRLGKREVLLIIQDIWKERRKDRSDNSNLAEFVDKYFRERYLLICFKVLVPMIKDQSLRINHQNVIHRLVTNNIKILCFKCTLIRLLSINEFQYFLEPI